MADNYTGTDWQTRTKITTDIMSKIDEGLKQNTDLIDSYHGRQYLTSLDDVIALADSMVTYSIQNTYIAQSVMSDLGGSSGVAKGFIAKTMNASGTFDFFLVVTTGSIVYTGRYDNGTTTLYRLTTTLVS